MSTHVKSDTAGPSAEAHNPDRNEETWIASFDLRLSAAKLTSVANALLDALAEYDPMTSTSQNEVVCTFGVRGSTQTALAFAIDALWTALEDCSASEAQIVAANLISSTEFDRLQAESEPLQFLCASDCARELDISKQRIGQLIDAGDFPAPDAEVGGRLGWKVNKIRAYGWKRRLRRLTHPQEV